MEQWPAKKEKNNEKKLDNQNTKEKNNDSKNIEDLDDNELMKLLNEYEKEVTDVHMSDCSDDRHNWIWMTESILIHIRKEAWKRGLTNPEHEKFSKYH